MRLFARLKDLIVGRALNLKDRSIFHRLSLAAFLAWVGLGADGLSSSCYGPQEAYLILGQHAPLALFVALLTALTIFVISASYSHVIEAFPAGGGGYAVASKLLSPTVGMISGCALLVDYLLAVTLSLASGADAIFSFLPTDWGRYKLLFACASVAGMTILNLRGVKESVRMLLPIFLTFLLAHAAAVVYGVAAHAGGLSGMAGETAGAVAQTTAQLGAGGTAFLVLQAYGMGGGTYTGLEAVSNGLPILREPRTRTGKRTMVYMAVSLSVLVTGLLLNYVLYKVAPQPGKTLNAVFLGAVVADWGGLGQAFATFTLLTEAALLFAGAQTGFIGGPRVMGYMAEDRWLPIRFTRLSDRLVIRNGVLVIGALAATVMLLTRGAVGVLVILFSINVFITFTLSQLGMVVHWVKSRHSGKPWKWRLFVNGLGFVLSLLILTTMLAVKFTEGGWVTLVGTAVLAGLAWLTHRHYGKVRARLEALNWLVTEEEQGKDHIIARPERSRLVGPDGGSDVGPDIGKDIGKDVRSDVRKEVERDSGPAAEAETAVVLVNGFNGYSLYSLSMVSRTFRTMFERYVLIEVGVVDAQAFEDEEAVAHAENKVRDDLAKFVELMRKHGYQAEGVSSVSTDLTDSLVEQVVAVRERYPNAMAFAGQIVFPRETFITRLLHNDVVFAAQRRLYRKGIPFFIIPICLGGCEEEDEAALRARPA